MKAFALLAAAAVVYAGPAATVTGRVADPTGAVVQDAEVQAVNVETGAKFAVKTNDEGLYSMASLVPGTYRIIVARHGFRTVIKPGVELRVQDVIALNFEMQLGSVDQSVTVEEGAPLIQADTAMLGHTVDRNVMAELPSITRNPYDFVALSAGATPAANIVNSDCTYCGMRGVGVSINGQRPESANIQLDGSENVNPLQGTPGNSIPHEAVREYRVLTNSFTAEYGRNAGFVANLVTKGGTNEIHGSAYDYARNSFFCRQ